MGHLITKYTVRGYGAVLWCSCGWRHEVAVRNALGRAAKVRAAMRRHYAEADAAAWIAAAKKRMP